MCSEPEFSKMEVAIIETYYHLPDKEVRMEFIKAIMAVVNKFKR